MPSNRIRRSTFRPWTALVLLLTLTAEPGAADPAGPSGFVQRDGTLLVRDGQPYVFTGLDVYNAATWSGTCWYPMADDALDASLTAIGPGKEAFRAWSFQYEATGGR